MAAVLAVGGCGAFIPSGNDDMNREGTVTQIDTAYRELVDLEDGLGDAIGVTWGDPTAIGPGPCRSADGYLEVWLDRNAQLGQPIDATLATARAYLTGRGLAVDATGFPEFRDDALFADRVTGRRGELVVELRAATNGTVQVTGISECIPGDWTQEWEPPAA